ncbi:MAG: RHS repeat domain-containing protein [Planctomycetaceae bacterium]
MCETNSSGPILVEYSHTGRGQTVITDYPQPDLKLDLYQGTSGTYAGLDRFARTIDQFWDGYGSTADVTRIKYGHDYASIRTWAEDVIAENNTVDLDELYTYDGLHRLSGIERGEINGTYTSISSDTFGQDWSLDQLGNWANFLEDDDGDGTDELDQDRTHNDVNEITAITATTGANWVDPTYDAAGNMLTGPTPGDETATQKYVYDAWNRLVKVTDGSDVTIAEYEYDGRNYRIVKAVYSGGMLSYTDDFYYNEDWQELEVRRDGDTDPREQYVWHTDYIDALAVRYYDADTDGNLAENNDGPHYYTQGANYHVHAAVNASGTVLERYHYDPYGRLLVLDPDFTPDADSTSDIDNPYAFTGRRLDAESSLYYFRNRYFNNSTGCFLIRDLLPYIDGMHLYRAYFAPARTDPTGMSLAADFDRAVVNYKCLHACEEDCLYRFPGMWDTMSRIGCIHGCNIGCSGHSFSICGFLNSMTPCQKSLMHCVCAASELIGFIPIHGSFGVAHVVADCACDFYESAERLCAVGGSYSAAESGAGAFVTLTAHDCLMDISRHTLQFGGPWAKFTKAASLFFTEGAGYLAGRHLTHEACIEAVQCIGGH